MQDIKSAPKLINSSFGALLVSKENLIKNHNIIGKKPDFIIISDIEAIDIDTPLDFYIASQMYQKLIIDGKDLLDK